MTFKRINKETLLYHLFEFKNSRGQLSYALFDADMDMPVAYGSRNFVMATVSNLPKYVTVIYYKPDTDKITFYNPPQQRYKGTKNNGEKK